MRSSVVFLGSINIIVYALCFVYEGQVVSGQDISLCKRPELGEPCIIKCSKENAVQATKLYKENNLKAECSSRGVCTETDNIVSQSWGNVSTVFTIKQLKATDTGNWSCQINEKNGAKQFLQVYSFNEDNIKVSLKRKTPDIHTVTVDMKCVYPEPIVIMTYCGVVFCKERGNVFFNGPCQNDKEERHMNVSCPLRSPQCKGSNVVEITIYIKRKRVYTSNVVLGFSMTGVLKDKPIPEQYIYRTESFSVNTFLAAVGCMVVVLLVYMTWKIYKVRERRKGRNRNFRRDNSSMNGETTVPLDPETTVECFDSSRQEMLEGQRGNSESVLYSGHSRSNLGNNQIARSVCTVNSARI